MPLLAVLLLPPIVRAQVGEGVGPLSERSTNVSSGSRPVGEGSQTVREGSSGSMISGPVRDPGTPSMRSGPVSEVSRGAVTAEPRWREVGAVDETLGAVAREAARPVGLPLHDPERDLAELQRRLRALREEAQGLSPESRPGAAEVDQTGRP